MTRKRVLEIVLEIAIALGIVGVILLDAFYVPEDFWPKWMSFRVIAFSGITFGYPLKRYRRLWRKPSFWGVFLALLAAHLVIFTLFFRNLGALWVWLLTPVEWTVILPVLEAAGDGSSDGASNENQT